MSELGLVMPFWLIVLIWLARTVWLVFICTLLAWLAVRANYVVTLHADPRIAIDFVGGKDLPRPVGSRAARLFEVCHERTGQSRGRGRVMGRFAVFVCHF